MASPKTKVLWLPKWYPNRLDRLDGNFIESHAIAVAPYCEMVVLFVHSDPDLPQRYQVEKATEYGFPVIRVYFKRSSQHIPVLTAMALFFRYIKAQLIGYREVVKDFGEPDLAHIHVLTRSSFLAWWLKIRKGIPYLISEHWSGYFSVNGAYRGWLKKWGTSFVVKRAAGVSTVSEHLRDAMVGHGLQNAYSIIANVVDTQLFTPKSSTLSPTSKKKLIHISTLDTVPKNFPKILHAMADLARERNDFELHVIGDGHEGEKQRELSRSLGLTDQTVFFYGNIEKEDVAAHFADAHALLIFSLWENQPCVMVESFAAGVPVIAPIVGGIPEHLDTKKGILIPPDDEQALKKAIRKILDEGIGHDPEAMHEYANQHFSNERVGQQFANLYLKVLSKKKEG